MPDLKTYAFILMIFLFLLDFAVGHSRLSCPSPRNPSTGLKVGPCDVNTNNFSGNAMVLDPGPFTIFWEESISHRGAPFRISLSQENSDALGCVLLDHIPHNDEGTPNYTDESTYVKYHITINIPNVSCNRCSLQLANPMTDKLVPAGSYCTDPNGTCFSVYHSCANVIIRGFYPMSQANCTQSPNWPRSSFPLGNYTTESGLWSNGIPVGYPEEFTNMIGDCVPSSGSSSFFTWQNVLAIVAGALTVVIMIILGIWQLLNYKRRQAKDYQEVRDTNYLELGK